MYLGVGYIKWYGGDADGAAEEFDAGVAQLRVMGERWALATTLSASADLADAQGDLARASALTDEALERGGAARRAGRGGRPALPPGRPAHRRR